MNDNTPLTIIDAAPDERAARGLYRALTLALIERGLTVSTMESCTGGLVASLITDTEGASNVFPGAFVTYCNAAKIAAGVPREIIDTHGVYSPQTAAAMARACRNAFGADIGVGVTGTMGNVDPANGDSVPGQAWFAIACGADTRVRALSLCPMPGRLACKLAVAIPIAETLLALLDASPARR